MVFAYSQGIWSTRKIEEACRLNLAFHYLLHGEKCPDHNTLYCFRKYHLSSCAEDLLTQFINLLSEQGEIPFENLFVDGTKIEANANRYRFVWAKAVRKNAEKLQIKAQAFFQERRLLAAIPETLQAADLRKALRQLEKEKERLGIVFVSGHDHSRVRYNGILKPFRIFSCGKKNMSTTIPCFVEETAFPRLTRTQRSCILKKTTCATVS